MAIDISRFHQTFFEESFEGLDTMEAALLRLTPESADGEAINGIFRAAHSIKGGAATFGFSAVAEFTHLLETLLDQMRSGERAVTSVEIDVLLRSVDVLRNLLNAARDGQPADAAGVARLSDELATVLTSAATVPDLAAAGVAPPAAAISGWRIRFEPRPQLFSSGNDPVRILRELAGMGATRIRCDTDTLPDLADVNPEACYLAWDIELLAPCSREAVMEVFAWVEDECHLMVAPLNDVTADDAPLPDLSAQPQAPVAHAAAESGPHVASAPTPLPERKAPAPVAAADRRSEASRGDAGSIRIATEKIDSLVNLVGELVITQAMLQQLASVLDPVQYEKLFAGLSQLDRNTRSLQEAVMSTRMLPVDFVFSRFPRMVRDLAAKLGKQVRLISSGEQTEIDKSVIERIADPLTHLVRNAIDHGIEAPEQRISAGKDPVGVMRLSASHQGGHIVVEIADDGRGLDRARILAKAAERGLPASEALSDAEVWHLIFAPGFSTAAEVTDVSGRGVGMDVVKKNIEALNGAVDIASEPGKGMRVTIRLPLTLAILDGMSVRAGDEIFILPLSSVVESLQPAPDQVKRVAQDSVVVRVRNEYVPLVDLREWFTLPGRRIPPHEAIVVIVEAEGKKLAMQIDDLVGQQQVVIKNLESNYRRVRGISGATILGDGRVALIVDIGAVVRLLSLPPNHVPMAA